MKGGLLAFLCYAIGSENAEGMQAICSGKVSYSCILLTCWAASALSVLFMWFRSGNVNTLR
jgi:hypothetical protein